jgi:hypothetical protein
MRWSGSFIISPPPESTELAWQLQQLEAAAAAIEEALPWLEVTCGVDEYKSPVWYGELYGDGDDGEEAK